MRKKVCFVRSNSMRGDSRVEKEMDALLSSNYEVFGIGWDRNLDEKDIYHKKIDKHKVNIIELKEKSVFGAGFIKNLFPLVKFQLKLYKELKKNRNNFDIIHACDFDTALTCFIFSRRYDKKLVYDIFDFYVDAFNVPSLIKGIIKKIDFKIINSAEATIICTEERKKQIIGSIPNKLTVVHNSPQLVNFKKGDIIPLSSLNNKTKICYFGILNDGRLLKELLNIIKNNTNFELHIGGFGKYESLVNQYCAECTNIYYYGKLDYKMVLNYEYQCDIITALYDPKVKNHYYAAPNKFYEALMLGKPIIMCSKTGMSNIVAENDIGEVISEFNEKSLLVGLEKLVNRKEEWKEMGLREKKLYSDIFSWENSKRKLIELYKGI